MSERIKGIQPETPSSPEIFIDLSPNELIAHSVANGEGKEYLSNGPLVVETHPDTGRYPKDAYAVTNAASENVDTSVSKPMTPEQFERILKKTEDHLMTQPAQYRQHLEVGADEAHRIHVETVSESAASALFTRNLFRVPTDEPREDAPTYRLLHAPTLKLSPDEDGTESERAIVLDFESRTVVIAGTKYFGEQKKALFKAMQKELPSRGVLSMHCSANIAENGETALFFGLSGTGKTTLSTDPERKLIGDDEHGWSDTGIFNIEGGSYAKAIDIREDKEPEIYRAIHMRGTVLENVPFDEEQGKLILSTEELEARNRDRVARGEKPQDFVNMRAAYPLSSIENSSETGLGNHPNHIIFLTASDVLPPVAHLTQDEAVYHFLSGYTSKMPGTEKGVTSPIPEFSAGYGQPFLVYPPTVYAELFEKKLKEHEPHVWMVNTGWPFGLDRGRMDITDTRRIISSILSNQLQNMDFARNDLGFTVPVSIPGVEINPLQMRQYWSSEEAYVRSAREVAHNFAANFERKGFENTVPARISSSGPRFRG